MTLPKVLLHDHLDGGLRPRTVAELAAAAGYPGLPAEPADIEQFFEEAAIGSLPEYLQTFEHTVALMQTPEALRRVAIESVVDHAADDVIYAELRLCPSLHTQRGLTRAEVIEAVLEGLEMGQDATGITARLIVSAMRDREGDIEDAKAATQFVDQGVVGFDLAGPERGFPARDHAEALQLAADSGLRLTIHAGEGSGVASIQGALDCGAERIGHGIRLIEDVHADNTHLRFGPTADRIRYERIALEICFKSEVDTRAVMSATVHPIDVLHRAGFATTINTDNRLMSMTDMTHEFELLATHKGFGLRDFEQLTINAIDAAFCDAATKEEIRSRVRHGYDEHATA